MKVRFRFYTTPGEVAEDVDTMLDELPQQGDLILFKKAGDQEETLFGVDCRQFDLERPGRFTRVIVHCLDKSTGAKPPEGLN